jgi:hypothetical protein
MPTAREWRERDVATADRELYARAAAWLRDDPVRRRTAGLWSDRVGHALADLLDALSENVAGLDPGVRHQTRQACRTVVGEPMENPTTRRSRRRS